MVNQEISPFLSMTIVVTFKKFNPKKYSLDSKMSAVYSNDSINRVLFFFYTNVLNENKNIWSFDWCCEQILFRKPIKIP